MSESPKPTTPVELNQYSVKMLSMFLGAPGWTDKEGQTYRASVILRDCIPELPDEPSSTLTPASTPAEQQAAAKAQVEWAKAPCSISLTERQKDIVKKCLKHFEDQKKLQASVYMIPLYDLAGLAPDA